MLNAALYSCLAAGNIMVPLEGVPEDGAAAEAAGGSQGAGCGSSREEGSTAECQRGVMTFIDFEYADLAPRGFDWGNHFCE